MRFIEEQEPRPVDFGRTRGGEKLAAAIRAHPQLSVGTNHEAVPELCRMNATSWSFPNYTGSFFFLTGRLSR